MARLKAHHPREFYAAIFNCHKSMYPLRAFVWDAMRHNIPVFPPNINSSEPRWTPVHNGVLAGLTCIRGLTRATVDRIAAQRTQTPFLGLRDLLERVPFQAGELERLILVGACRDWGERNTLIRAIQHTDKRGRQLSLFMRDNRTLPPLPISQLMLTGIPFGAHPTELLRRDGICPARNMTRHINGNVRMMGILNAVKVMHTTATASAPRREMSFVTLEDESGVFDVVLFPDAHRRYHRLFNHVGPFVVDGRISEQWDSCSLELQHVHCLSAN
jgi:DNA polymerase III alpha subunit